MSEAAPAKESGGKSCGCGCLGCFFGCFGTCFLVFLLLTVAAWFYGPQMAQWVLTEGGSTVTGLIEGFVAERTARPPALPPLPLDPQAMQAVDQKVAQAMQGGAEPPLLQLTEEEANLFMRTSLARSGLATEGGLVHDAYMWLGAGQARVVAALRGPALARRLPQTMPAGAGGRGGTTMRPLLGLLERSPYVNLEAQLRVVPGDPVRLRPESVSLLGIPIPVGTLQGLLEAAARQGEAPGSAGPQLGAGLPLPGVQELRLQPGELRFRRAPGAAGAGLPGSPSP